MPSLPEFADISGNIRQIEVAVKVISKAFCAADRHIGITGKITINLERVSNYRKNQRKSMIFGGGGKYCVGEKRYVVGDYYFFEKTYKEYLQTFFEVFKGDISVFVKLRDEVVGFNNRTGNKLGEEGYI